MAAHRLCAAGASLLATSPTARTTVARRLSVVAAGDALPSTATATATAAAADYPGLRHILFVASCVFVVLWAGGCGPSNERSSHAAEAGTSQRPAETGRTPVITATHERIKAVVLDAREEFGDSTLGAIQDLGATHISLVSFGFQEEASTPQIRFSPDVRWYSESVAGARSIAERAASFGLRVILKPQLWLRGGAWTADIGFQKDSDWQAWEADYRDFLLHTAMLAAEIDAEMIIIGTELSTSVRQRPAFWRSLIADIREVYGGKLTYGANWHDDYEHVSFWDALDYIGVNAYFPISDGDSPSLSDLRRGWARHSKALESLAYRENLPVVFTEIGYRSVPYAAAEPWRWPSREEVGEVQPDFVLQSNLFRAFFDTVWTAPWFAGAVIWKVYPVGPHRYGSDRHALDFTPQNKPAEGVIRDVFSSP